MVIKLKQKCYKAFEADTNIIQEFIKHNTEQWTCETSQYSSGKYIWIGLFMVEKWMSWMQPKFLYAKGLEKKYNHHTLVLDWEYNEDLEKLYQSYGFQFVCVKKRMFKDVIGFLLGLVKAIKFFVCDGTGDKMISLCYKGRKIGQYIYDNTVRTRPNIYTIRNARTKTCFKKICTSYWFLHTLEIIAREYEPAFYLYDDLVYDEGMIIQMMHRKKVSVLKCGVGGHLKEIPWSETPQYRPDILRESVTKNLERLSDLEKEKIILAVTKELELRFKGENGVTREAAYIFKNKKEVAVDELKKEMGLDPKKKTVIIFAHCFSENPHKCSKQLYDDSYTWLEETMKYVRNIDTANWVIKGHPIAAIKYNEVGVLESMYEKYKNENLHWFSNEYNSSLATQIADVIITVYGTAGMEYSCLGIPTIHTGYASYAGFGYTYFPQTIEEYHTLLKQVDKIPRLSSEQLRTAKLVFAVYNDMQDKCFDEFDYQMNALNELFYQDINEKKSFFEHNNLVFKEIIKYLEKNDMKNTQYYQKAFET